jgi:O-antigen ligase
MLVILSYFFPQMLSLFEIRGANTEMVRVFGIMDDEVSVFLSFFLFEALVFRRFIAFAIYLLAIFFTVGLGASFTVTLLLLYFLFFMIRKTKRNLYLMAFSFLFLVISATLFFRSITESALIQRIKNLPTEDKNNPLAKRLLSYQVAIEMIKERPLLGYGYGNYSQSVIQRYRPKFTDVKKDRFFDGSAKVIMSYTFNPFLQMTAEAGIIGLLVFIFFLYKMIHSVKLKIPDETSFEKKFNDASSIWLLIFVLSTLSANWFLPSSFLLLLVVSLVGINEKLKSLYLDEPAEEII